GGWVRRKPRSGSTMKPVARRTAAGSVSKARVPETRSATTAGTARSSVASQGSGPPPAASGAGGGGPPPPAGGGGGGGGRGREPDRRAAPQAASALRPGPRGGRARGSASR